MIKQLMTLSLMILFSCSSLFADEIDKQNAQLKALGKEIQSLKKTLKDEKTQADQLNNKLANTDKSIGEIAKQITILDAQLYVQESKLKSLTDRKSQYHNELQAQRTILFGQLQAAYRLGKHEYLQLLLNQQDPNKIDRAFTYFQLLNKTRVHVMQGLNKTLENLMLIQNKITEHKTAVLQLRNKRSGQKQKLESYQVRRRALLKKLAVKIKTHAKELSELLENKEALELLIGRLQAQANAMIAAPFATMKGRLPWPTSGSIVRHFWSKIAHGKMRYNGILIRARNGNAVRAMYPGKVVFSDWLSGFGLLLIIQHSPHFMTLYGHNQSLYQKAGEFVETGDLIATVGKSGGYKRSGLYFEIREDGKPLNPETWLRKQ